MKPELEVINTDGWRMSFEIPEGIISIGSDSNNQITLEEKYGSNVEGRHLQVISGLGNNGYQVVNLTNSPITYNTSQVLPSFEFIELTEKTVISLGDFTLIFNDALDYGNVINHGDVIDHNDRTNRSDNSNSNSSNSISIINLTLSKSILHPDDTDGIEGELLLRNSGKKFANFEIKVNEELRPCFQIGTTSICPPNGKDKVKFKLIHTRAPEPVSRKYPMTIEVTAEKYPGESAQAYANIDIAPFFQHSLLFG